MYWREPLIVIAALVSVLVVRAIGFVLLSAELMALGYMTMFASILVGVAVLYALAFRGIRTSIAATEGRFDAPHVRRRAPHEPLSDRERIRREQEGETGSML